MRRFFFVSVVPFFFCLLSCLSRIVSLRPSSSSCLNAAPSFFFCMLFARNLWRGTVRDCCLWLGAGYACVYMLNHCRFPCASCLLYIDRVSLFLFKCSLLFGLLCSLVSFFSDHLFHAVSPLDLYSVVPSFSLSLLDGRRRTTKKKNGRKKRRGWRIGCARGAVFVSFCVSRSPSQPPFKAPRHPSLFSRVRLLSALAVHSRSLFCVFLVVSSLRVSTLRWR